MPLSLDLRLDQERPARACATWRGRQSSVASYLLATLKRQPKPFAECKQEPALGLRSPPRALEQTVVALVLRSEMEDKSGRSSP